MASKGTQGYVKKQTAVHDLFGWYRRTEILENGKWKVLEVGDYHETRDECLIDENNCKYEYIDKN